MSEETVSVVVATIAAGESLSDAVYTGGLVPCSLEMPAAWDTADITFQAASDDEASVADVYENDGTELTIKAAASQFISLDPTKLLGARYIKIRSGISASAVNQTLESKIKLAIKLN